MLSLRYVAVILIAVICSPFRARDQQRRGLLFADLPDATLPCSASVRRFVDQEFFRVEPYQRVGPSERVGIESRFYLHLSRGRTLVHSECHRRRLRCLKNYFSGHLEIRELAVVLLNSRKALVARSYLWKFQMIFSI